MTGPVTTALDGDVWHVTLDDAARGNVVDQAMAEQLRAALEQRPGAVDQEVEPGLAARRHSAARS